MKNYNGSKMKEISSWYIARVAKLRLASRMLIHFKLDYQEALPPHVYSLSEWTCSLYLSLSLNGLIVFIVVVNII